MAACALAVQRPPPAAAVPGRTRPLLRLSLLPLSLLHIARIDRLVQLVGDRYDGWGKEPDGGPFFVDVLERDTAPGPPGSGIGVDRFRGETLHVALGEALRAARGTR